MGDELEWHRMRGMNTYHAPKPLLPSSVPQLQSHFESVNVDLFGDKKSAGG